MQGKVYVGDIVRWVPEGTWDFQPANYRHNVRTTRSAVEVVKAMTDYVTDLRKGNGS